MGDLGLEIMTRAAKWFPRRFNFCLERTLFRYGSCHFYTCGPPLLPKAEKCLLRLDGFRFRKEVVRSYIGWRGERNILHKDVKISP